MVDQSKRRYWLGFCWRVFRVVLVVYAALIALLLIFQPRFVFIPSRRLAATPDEWQLPYEEVALVTSDGVRLSGWFIPVEGATTTILLLHGNAGNISHRRHSLEVYYRLGYNCLIIDYRGYGASEGRPGEQGTYLDAQAAWDYLVNERKIAAERIVIFGRSLGGAVAVWLAAQVQPQALVVESTFTSISDMAAKMLPFLPMRWLCRIKYDSLALIDRIKCPLLVIHSPDDEIIPFEQGRRLYEAAKEPKAFYELSGAHNEGFVLEGSKYSSALKEFIANREQN